MFTGKLLNDNRADNNISRSIADHQQYTRETLPTRYYIWHTCGDDKVRSSHAELDGTVRSVDEDIFPSEEHNCRCWAEEISD